MPQRGERASGEVSQNFFILANKSVLPSRTVKRNEKRQGRATNWYNSETITIAKRNKSPFFAPTDAVSLPRSKKAMSISILPLMGQREKEVLPFLH